MAAAAADRLLARRPHVALGARLRTTPGRLRLAAGVLALAAIAFGVVMATAAASRNEAADAVADRTEPLLVEADGLYAALSDADATATTTFLIGGLEPVDRRRRYLADLAVASRRLTRLTEEVGGSADARRAVATVAARLPVYSGLIETARANNRQGLPVGADYLRRASGLMRDEILPAAGRIYETEARKLDDDYRASTSATGYVALAIAGSLLLAMLVLTQVGLARFTHRILNVPLVLATVLLVAVAAWILVAFTSAQNALSDAQRKGSDSVQVLSAVRFLALRAQRDEGLALSARGGDTQDVADFETVLRVLGPTGSTGLLGDASRLAARAGSTAGVDRLRTSIQRYQDAHRRVAAAKNAGSFDRARRIFIGPETQLSDRIGADLEAQIAGAQGRFARSARDATSDLDALVAGIAVLAAGIAALSVAGLAQRIGEYR
jgi:hypothetical protein